MNLGRMDLNLLVYLDVLLRERNVTKAAGHLGISQPAMSNGLRRLRDLFGDPILVRTSEGMSPTERALELQPIVRQVLATVEQTIQPEEEFNAESSHRVFRIMASDYAEATLLPYVLQRLRDEAPNIVLDIINPSDMSFTDVEQGHVDLVINRFDDMPQSFHQVTLWRDNFSCLLSAENPVQKDLSLDAYLEAHHVWVSKTGMGAGIGITPGDVKRLGWVDEALKRIDKQRQIRVFTRHYQSAVLLAEQRDLVITIPSKITQTITINDKVVIKEPPFAIPPFELKMAWSPLLQHNVAHQWMRRLITDAAHQLDG